MQFGYMIIYVPDVELALAFYEQAFNLERAFLHKSKQYGELKTGATKLVFVSESLALSNGVDFTKNQSDQPAAGFEIALVTDEVEEAYRHACEQGAFAVTEPTQKPWGQTVAYVRDLNGVLVELCSPMDSIE